MEKSEIVKKQFKGFDFGSYCYIEMKRYVGKNEFYRHKVIGRLYSNFAVNVPIDDGPKGTQHKEVLVTGEVSNPTIPVLRVVREGLVETKVFKVAVKDVLTFQELKDKK